MTVKCKMLFSFLRSIFLLIIFFISWHLVAEHNFPQSINDLVIAGQINNALLEFNKWSLLSENEFELFPSIINFVTISPKPSTVDSVLAVYSSLLTDEEIAIIRAIPVDWAELNGNMEEALEIIENSSHSSLGSSVKADLRQLGLLLELGYHFDLQNIYGIEEIPIQLSVAIASNSTKTISIETILRKAFGEAESSFNDGHKGALAGYGLVSMYLAEGLIEEAKNTVRMLHEKFPKSPEYFLALNRLSLEGLEGLEVEEFVSPASLIWSNLLQSHNTFSASNAGLLNQEYDIVEKEKTDISKPLFYIQIGAYGDLDNAQQMVLQLRSHGVEAKVEQDKDNLQRVIIPNELGREKALNLLKKIRTIGFDGYLKTAIPD